MPRPKTKDELIAQSQYNFDRLYGLIDSYSESQLNREFPKGTLNRNIRDVLAHLHHWHIMMKKWYEVGMRGEKPDMPAKGYTWQTLPALNAKIWSACQNLHIDEARSMLNKSHEEVMELIKSHSNEELFEKKRYDWTGSTSLGAYFISNTSSHYAWAWKLIRKGLKNV